MTKRGKLVRLLPALVLALTAAACGNGSSSDTQTLQPADLVKAAVTKTSQQQSSRIVIDTKSDVGAVSVDLKGEGEFDFAKRVGHFSMALPGGAGKIDEIVLAKTLYLRITSQGPTYYTLPMDEVVGTQLGSSTDPTAGLQALLAISNDVKRLGTVTVRGAKTTHYRGTYDLKAAVAKAQGLAKRVLQSTLTMGATTIVPFDAYIDDSGRLRKLDQTVTTTMPQLQGQKVKVLSTLELYDFGLTVNVQKPTATQDGTALLTALKKQFPGSAG
jgi:hypothetical protein